MRGKVGRQKAVVVFLFCQAFFPIAFETFLKFCDAYWFVERVDILLHRLAKEETECSCLVEGSLVRSVLHTVGEDKHLAVFCLGMVEVAGEHLAHGNARQCGYSATYLTDRIAVAFRTVGGKALVTILVGSGSATDSYSERVFVTVVCNAQVFCTYMIRYVCCRLIEILVNGLMVRILYVQEHYLLLVIHESFVDGCHIRTVAVVCL